MCWQNTQAGATANQSCPRFVVGFDPSSKRFSFEFFENSTSNCRTSHGITRSIVEAAKFCQSKPGLIWFGSALWRILIARPLTWKIQLPPRSIIAKYFHGLQLFPSLLPNYNFMHVPVHFHLPPAQIRRKRYDFHSSDNTLVLGLHHETPFTPARIFWENEAGETPEFVSVKKVLRTLKLTTIPNPLSKRNDSAEFGRCHCLVLGSSVFWCSLISHLQCTFSWVISNRVIVTSW